jgi:hypothetical protein
VSSRQASWNAGDQPSAYQFRARRRAQRGRTQRNHARLRGQTCYQRLLLCRPRQARAAGAFGKGMTIFGLVVAVITLFSFVFFPVLAPLIWVVTVSIILIRRPALARAA